MTTDRAEHMKWCKERALAFVDDGDLVGALASLGSDFRKHQKTRDAAEMRRFIEGFA